MQLVSKKNFLIFLAAVLVVCLGYMAVTLSRRDYVSQSSAVDPEIQKVETQSNLDDVNSIEQDLEDTDYSGIDKDLQEVENELNQSY